MDTQKITTEILRASGFTESQLADMVPCSQPTINAFRNGKRGARPSLRIGMRLLEIHREYCGEATTAPDGSAESGSSNG